MALAWWVRCGIVVGLLAVGGECCGAEAPLRAAWGKVDVTPDLTGKRSAYLAGYGPNRRAVGVHDPIFSRATVLEIRGEKIALVSVDVVGLQYPAVQTIRGKLPGFKYVLVSSTHNHEAPDTIGLWGPSPLKCGVDPKWIEELCDKTAKMVQRAAEQLAPVTARYGTAEDDSLLGDSRQPKVFDGVLRVVRFDAARSDGTPLVSPNNREESDRKPLGLIVQWNCHPEAMGPRNKQITADFPWATIAVLEKKYGCPVTYFSGAVGGLMAPPDHVVKDAKGKVLKEGDFEYCRVYGEMVASLASKAIDRSQPIDLGSLAVSTMPIAVPLENSLYKVARGLGVLQRVGRKWTGDAEKLGEPVDKAGRDWEIAVETEVAYLRLGELHVACIPGELYPELVYGKFQDPADPAADFPQAPLEKPVMKILPGEKTLLIGLANDEIGYIIPKRQWDREAPYCYGRSKNQYGEINSCGPEVAPILMRALENRVREAGK